MTRQGNEVQRKEQIRSAATRCFVRNGYSATRLLDIAKEAGLSKGGVYFHYRAKEELFHDILDAQLQKMCARWSYEPLADQSADRTLARLVHEHVTSVGMDPDQTRLFNLLVTMAGRDESFRARLEDAMAAMHRAYAIVIERGMVEGVFARGDAGAIASSVIAMLQGFGNASVVRPDGRLHVDPGLVVDLVLRMVQPARPVTGLEFGAQMLPPPVVTAPN